MKSIVYGTIILAKYLILFMIIENLQMPSKKLLKNVQTFNNLIFVLMKSFRMNNHYILKKDYQIWKLIGNLLMILVFNVLSNLKDK